MTNLFEYYKGTLDELIQSAKDRNAVGIEKKIIAAASDKLVEELKDKGV